jgi:hypothetical protein
MQSVEKFNELLEKMNQKAQLELDIKDSIVDLASSFSENYYFQAINSSEHNTLSFCFYLPQKAENDNDTQKKSFTEVEIRNCFEFVENDDFSEGLEFNGFEVKINQFTAPLDVCLSMMYGAELKSNLAPAYISQLVEREDLTPKAIMQSQSNEKLSFIDFISQINKDHIKPYLKSLTINLDGKNYEQSKSDKKEFIKEYSEIFDKLIHSLYSNKSLINGINDSEIKEVTDLMIHNSYTKMDAKLGEKETKTKAMKL